MHRLLLASQEILLSHIRWPFKQLSDPHKRAVTSKSWPKYPQYACDFYRSVDKQSPSSLPVSKTFLLNAPTICLILKLLLQSSFLKYAFQSMLLKLVLRHLPTLWGHVEFITKSNLKMPLVSAISFFRIRIIILY